MCYGETYYSYEELKSAVESYIKYYNVQRKKQSLSCMSPVEFRLHHDAAQNNRIAGKIIYCAIKSNFGCHFT